MDQHDTLATLEAATRDPSCPLHFTPVLMRARVDGWTEVRQRRFIAALALTGQVGRATAIAGMSAQSLRHPFGKPDSGSFRDTVAAASQYARRPPNVAPRQRTRGSEVSKPVSWGAPISSSIETSTAEPPANSGAIGGVGERRPTGGSADRIDAVRPLLTALHHANRMGSVHRWLNRAKSR